MIAFFPDVSALSTIFGFQERNSRAVSEAPVKITESTSLCDTRCLPASASSALTNCTNAGSTPAPLSALCTALIATSAHRTTCGAGLIITAAPAASAANTPPMGMATGKFHGGVTNTTLNGVNFDRATSNCRADSA